MWVPHPSAKQKGGKNRTDNRQLATGNRFSRPSPRVVILSEERGDESKDPFSRTMAAGCHPSDARSLATGGSAFTGNRQLATDNFFWWKHHAHRGPREAPPLRFVG